MTKNGKTAKNSTNLVRKPQPKRKAKYGVSKSFRTAFNKMLPSKELRKDFTDIALFTNGTVADRTHYVYLDNIAQGTQYNQRIRNTVHVSWLHLNGTVQNDSTTKVKHIRFVVIKERNQGHFSSAMTDLLHSTGTSSSAPSGYQGDGQLNINRDQYIIIYDRRRVVPIESEGALTIKEKIKINRLVMYPQNNSASSTPVDGHLILIVMVYDADNVPTATTVKMAILGRVFYKDYNKPYLKS